MSQNLTIPSFEIASEYGVPKSAPTPAEVLLCGYTRQDYDLRTEFTWKFLREADRRQVDGIVNSALSADNKLVTGTILRRIFDPAEKRNEFGHRVFGLYNGTDGITPPDHLGKTFPANTTHYLASGNAVLDSLDIEDAVRMIRDKGYGLGNGSHLVIFANPARKARLSNSGGRVRNLVPAGRSRFGISFPVRNAFPYLTDQQIVGETAPTDYNGLEDSRIAWADVAQ